jgi:hypothetical protein
MCARKRGAKTDCVKRVAKKNLLNPVQSAPASFVPNIYINTMSEEEGLLVTWRKAAPPYLATCRIVRHGDLVAVSQIARALQINVAKVLHSLSKRHAKLYPSPCNEILGEFFDVKEVEHVLKDLTTWNIETCQRALAILDHNNGGSRNSMYGPKEERYKKIRYANLKRVIQHNATIPKEPPVVSERTLRKRQKNE